MQATIIGLSIAVEPKQAAYIPLGHDCPGTPAQLDREDVLNRLKPLLEDADKAKVGQNAKYDMNVLSTYGITVRGVADDTMLESYVLNSTAIAPRHGFARHSVISAHETIPYEDVTGKGAKQISFSQVDIETACQLRRRGRRRHAAPASRAVAEARRRAEPSLACTRDIEMPLVPVLARMEQTGVLIDTGALKRQSHELARRMHELTEQCVRARRSQFQPRFAQAAAGDPVRRAETAGVDEDAERPAVDERGSARGDRRTITRCRA